MEEQRFDQAQALVSEEMVRELGLKCLDLAGMIQDVLRQMIPTTYHAANSISTVGDVQVTSAGGTATFRAGNSVICNLGFEVETGSEFIIEIGGCP